MRQNRCATAFSMAMVVVGCLLAVFKAAFPASSTTAAIYRACWKRAVYVTLSIPVAREDVLRIQKGRDLIGHKGRNHAEKAGSLNKKLALSDNHRLTSAHPLRKCL
jgi:hypothetical protein